MVAHSRGQKSALWGNKELFGTRGNCNANPGILSTLFASSAYIRKYFQTYVLNKETTEQVLTIYA
jgi:hypothetical protein